MKSIEFYHNWMFYGGLAGCAVGGIFIFILCKKMGAKNVNGKHFFMVSFVCFFPTIVLPVLLMPQVSLKSKLFFTLLVTFVGIARYWATTQAQENIWKLRRQNKDSNRDQNTPN